VKIDLPRDVTRRERLVLFGALLIADEATGEVCGELKGESGKQRLMRLLDHSEGARMKETLRALENRGLIRRIRTRLFVVLGAFVGPRVCEGCRDPMYNTGRAAARWCAGCRQVIGRSDRAWQLKAISLLVAGKTPPEIHAALKRPLWRAPDGDTQSSAIVPYLLAQGLLDATWRVALKRALEGGGE